MEYVGKLARALAVMVLDPKISAWLAENDPKALEQAKRALDEEGGLPGPDDLAKVMGEFAPNSNIFPEQHKGNLCDALWSLCRKHGEHRMAEELTTVSNKMRAAQWDVLGKEKV